MSSKHRYPVSNQCMGPPKKFPNVLKGPQNLDNDHLSDLLQLLYISGNPITLKSHNISLILKIV